jgi:hypothetical protein
MADTMSPRRGITETSARLDEYVIVLGLRLINANRAMIARFVSTSLKPSQVS